MNKLYLYIILLIILFLSVIKFSDISNKSVSSKSKSKNASVSVDEAQKLLEEQELTIMLQKERFETIEKKFLEESLAKNK